MLTIRKILELPEEYRAVTATKKRKKPKVFPSEDLLARQEQIRQAGIEVEMVYDRLTKSHYLKFNPQGKEVPAWQ